MKKIIKFICVVIMALFIICLVKTIIIRYDIKKIESQYIYVARIYATHYSKNFNYYFYYDNENKEYFIIKDTKEINQINSKEEMNEFIGTEFRFIHDTVADLSIYYIDNNKEFNISLLEFIDFLY